MFSGIETYSFPPNGEIGLSTGSRARDCSERACRPSDMGSGECTTSLKCSRWMLASASTNNTPSPVQSTASF